MRDYRAVAEATRAQVWDRWEEGLGLSEISRNPGSTPGQGVLDRGGERWDQAATTTALRSRTERGGARRDLPWSGGGVFDA